MSRLRVGIIGAGRIAQGFDDPNANRVLTLAHAVAASPELELGGFFDVDSERAAAAERRWGCPASPRDRTRWLASAWDLLAIATPDAAHAADVRDAIAARPRGILLEKPAASDPVDADALLREAAALGIPVVVDYPRRWHTAVARVAAELGPIGPPQHAAFVFSGGPSRNAVHMVDLFAQWWGTEWAVTQARRLGRARLVTLGGAGHVEVVLIDARETYYVFEMHVFCASGKIELSRSPEVLSVSRVGAHDAYTAVPVLRDAWLAPMEDEPLLVRAFGALLALVRDADAAAAHARVEIARNAFIGRVLTALA